MSEQPVLTKPPNAAEIRAELEAMVVGDLLGPAGGESEELTERTVRDRYIVGVLAPSRAGAPSDAATEEEDEETPLIPDELAEGGRDTVDDGTTDKDVPVPAGHLAVIHRDDVLCGYRSQSDQGLGLLGTVQARGA